MAPPRSLATSLGGLTIAAEKEPKADMVFAAICQALDAGIDDAGRALSELAAGDAALEGFAADAVKFAGKAVASGGKGDPGPQAVAAADLANVLAGFGFAAAAVGRACSQVFFTALLASTQPTLSRLPCAARC